MTRHSRLPAGRTSEGSLCRERRQHLEGKRKTSAGTARRTLAIRRRLPFDDLPPAQPLVVALEQHDLRVLLEEAVEGAGKLGGGGEVDETVLWRHQGVDHPEYQTASEQRFESSVARDAGKAARGDPPSRPARRAQRHGQQGSAGGRCSCIDECRVSSAPFQPTGNP